MGSFDSSSGPLTEPSAPGAATTAAQLLRDDLRQQLMGRYAENE